MFSVSIIYSQVVLEMKKTQQQLLARHTYVFILVYLKQILSIGSSVK